MSLKIANSRSDQAPDTTIDELRKTALSGNLLVGTLTNIALPAAPTGEFKPLFESNALKDVCIALTWKGTAL